MERRTRLGTIDPRTHYHSRLLPIRIPSEPEAHILLEPHGAHTSLGHSFQPDQYQWVSTLKMSFKILRCLMVNLCLATSRPFSMGSSASPSFVCRTIPHTCIFPNSASLDYFPSFFQACQGSSPIRSSVKFFAFTFTSPTVGIVAGAVVKRTNKYRPANWFAWVVTIIGMGLFTLFRADASPGEWIGFMVVATIGTGILVSGQPCLYLYCDADSGAPV